jgi:nicotinamidase-related amidase
MRANPNLPSIIAIDLQKEYTTPGRPFFLRGIEPSLEKCRAILAEARRRAWTLVHVRHEQAGELFNPESPYSDFIEGCNPLPSERVFVKGQRSCYSNPGFARLMAKLRSRPVYVIGYGSPLCCLATFIDAQSRGHGLTFVRDASHARAFADLGEGDAHRSATAIIGLYGSVATADDVLAAAIRHAA